MVRISNKIWYSEAQPFEIRKNDSFCQTIQNSDKNVQILDGLVFEWLGL